jgi:hypothetical protein
MSGRRNVLEKQRQREIEAEIGAEPDLLLMKNSNGVAKYFDDNGKQFVVPYGLGNGSPDLVGSLRVVVAGVVVGIWFCLEVKADGGELEPDQEKCHATWREFGAIIETVRSASEARAALERARGLFKAVAA